jgi:hypothetical protein
MKTFLRENWLWIAAPFVIVAAVVITVIVTTKDVVAPFVYTLLRAAVAPQGLAAFPCPGRPGGTGSWSVGRNAASDEEALEGRRGRGGLGGAAW